VELLSNSGNALSVNKRGQLTVSFKFGTALPEPVVVVILAQYQSLITISGEGEINFVQ
jgi:hypothetical protein